MYQKSKSIMVARIKVDQESKKHGIYFSISQHVLNNECCFILRQKILKLCEVNLANPTTKPFSMVSVQICPLNSLNSVGICSLAQKF